MSVKTQMTFRAADAPEGADAPETAAEASVAETGDETETERQDAQPADAEPASDDEQV